MKLKRIALFVGCCLAAVAQGGIVTAQPWSPAEAQPEIRTQIQSISSHLDQPIQNDALLAACSNPYKYVENNPAYDAVVAQGVAALPELERQLDLSAEDGLDQYILAIAMEEITHTDLKQQEQTTWESGKGFLSQWDAFLKTVPTQVRSILASERSREEMSSALAPYGILAQPYLSDYAQHQSLYSLAGLRYAAPPLLTQTELEELREYIEER